MLIQTENVCFGYDEKTILENISVTLNEGERIGFIGGNGEGKTTLLRLLTGNLMPDQGNIYRKTNLKFGYLEQSGGFDSENTVYEEMKTVFRGVFSDLSGLRKIEKELAEAQYGSEEFKALSARYEQLEKRIAAADGYNAEVRIRTVLNGMGFENAYDQVISTMSGGEKTRLRLCRLLLEEPELLFLDEPTNHLDVKTLFWLEEYLSSYKGAIFAVSHDRYFLDRTTTKIFELENKRIYTYRGNYSKYKILKEERLVHEWKEYEKQQEEIADLKDYIARNIVRATTAKSAQSRVKKLENMQILEKPLSPPKPPRFTFPFDEKSGEVVLSAENLTLKAGEKTLFKDAAFEIRRGEKTAVIGENGTGKSTLIRTIVNQGAKEISTGRYVKIGYYDQENANLDPNDTVLAALWHTHPYLTQTQARNLLAQAKLGDEDIEKEVRALSGGERAKLSLVVLEAEKANFLILDEPTNHLDLQARESLEKALREYEGTLLFVSHDRYFIQNIADKILSLDGGKISVFKGTYDEFNAQQKAEKEQIQPVTAPEKTEKTSYRSKADRAEDVKRKQTVKRLETEIGDIEAEIERLNEEISKPEIAGDYKLLSEKCARLEELHATLDKLYEEYEKVL